MKGTEDVKSLNRRLLSEVLEFVLNDDYEPSRMLITTCLGWMIYVYW